ncbi:MAG: hypothetical protein Q8O76_06825, partial [Chloroflexota bacterium]|nr:hypothetical protein [Chloroflexota bacterium]
MFLSSGEGLTPPWWPLLEKEGHILFQAEGSEQAREIARDHHPELCIIDLGCPEGREAYFDLGKEGPSLPPSLALVPRDQLPSYEPAPGMEDFVVVPCSGEELSLRVRQIMRRHGSEEGGRVVHRGDLAIDLNKYEVWVGGRPVYFTYTE